MLYLSALHVYEVLVKRLGGVVLVDGEVVVLVAVLDRAGPGRICGSELSCPAGQQQQGGQHGSSHCSTSLTRYQGAGHG